MCAGNPLNKTKLFRELCEDSGYHLTDRCNMYDLIFIQKSEFDISFEEIIEKELLLILDDTTWPGEALAIVACL